MAEIFDCSFCGKPSTEVKKLIAGPGVYICNECVGKCYEILLDGSVINSSPIKPAPIAEKQLPNPREIKEFLDEYVIGQDYAKEILSVSVYNHYKRLENPVIDGVEIDKANLLVVGKSGTGKTLLAQTIARFLEVPFAIADATSLTEAGYVGEDVESIISRLLTSANNDVKKAERGIIFIDEIDKKAARNTNSGNRDVSGEGVQQALLKMLEGADVMVAPAGVKKSPSTELTKVNTKNILFIVGGAFNGLEKIVERSISKDQIGIGFGAKCIDKVKSKDIDLLRQLEPEHLVEFGLIPELVGRLPIIAPLSELDEDQLVHVLTGPKNAIIKQFVAMFRVEGVQLDFTEAALMAVAKIAKLRKTNGRALRSVLESVLMKTQFKLPDFRENGVVRILIGEGTITGASDPEVFFES